MLRKGIRIEPPQIAVLASVGSASVRVFRQPCVGIVATGDELVEPSCTPRKGHIRNSNSSQLCAQVQSTGCIPRYYGIVRDDPVSLMHITKMALRECDVLLVSGGVSMGDFDFVPAILKKSGVRLLFEKIAVKPGHPTLFGVYGKKCVFGMPGNPVSTFVVFEMLVRPFLFRTAGTTNLQLNLRLELAGDIKRKKAERLEFRPVQLQTDGRVSPIEYHGSAHIHAYTVAEGIVTLPAGIFELKAGTSVGVTFLR